MKKMLITYIVALINYTIIRNELLDTIENYHSYLSAKFNRKELSSSHESAIHKTT